MNCEIDTTVRTGAFEGEEQAKGEEKSNRNNPTFKNRRNLMNPNEITFSNRDKNTTSASPHFRPWRIPKPLAKAAHSRPLPKPEKTAGSACCRPFVRAIQFRCSLPVSATVGTAPTVEAASAMEATATANTRVTVEAAHRT